MKALSVRQPWAWLIVAGYKSIENRTWSTRHRGPLLIHAASTMTADEYDACRIYLDGFTRIDLPAPGALKLGGFVGRVDLVDIINEDPVPGAHENAVVDNPWYMGDQGWVLQRPVSFDLIPARGFQRLWNVAVDHAHIPVRCPGCGRGGAVVSITGSAYCPACHRQWTARKALVTA